MTDLQEKLDKIGSDYKLRKSTARATYHQELAQAKQSRIEAKVQFGHDYLVQYNLLDQDMMSLVKTLTTIKGNETELQQWVDEAGRKADESMDMAHEAYNRPNWGNIALMASPLAVTFIGLVSYGLYNLEMPPKEAIGIGLGSALAGSLLLIAKLSPNTKEGMQEGILHEANSHIQEDRKLELVVQEASLPCARDVIQAFVENDPAHLDRKDDHERNKANLEMMDMILQTMAGTKTKPYLS